MWPLLLTWRELREGPGNGLQGGEVIVPSSVQSLVAADITMCKHLLAGGAHAAIQARLLGAGLPRALLVLLCLGARRPLSASEVPVRGQQLLLLGRVGQEHQQLVEDLLEVLPKQVPAALVILGCGDHALPSRARPGHAWPRPGPQVAGCHPPSPRQPDLSELPRVVLELAEASLIALQEVLDGLDELQVPLPEILGDQVGLWRWCQPGSGGQDREASVFGVAQAEGTLPCGTGQAARHTYAFVVVLVLETQAEWELGSRPEKPGGGLLTGGTKPGGGGGVVPFGSTTVLKPAGVAQHEPECDPPRPHSLLPIGHPASWASIHRPHVP